MTDNERLNLATRLYVRLRHIAGRVTDAIWMTQDQAYAREVLRLAYAHGDSELRVLADRFEQLMFGKRPVAVNGATSRPAPAPVKVATYDDTGEFSSTTEMELGRYTGSLR